MDSFVEANAAKPNGALKGVLRHSLARRRMVQVAVSYASVLMLAIGLAHISQRPEIHALALGLAQLDAGQDLRAGCHDPVLERSTGRTWWRGILPAGADVGQPGRVGQ